MCCQLFDSIIIKSVRWCAKTQRNFDEAKITQFILLCSSSSHIVFIWYFSLSLTLSCSQSMLTRAKKNYIAEKLYRFVVANQHSVLIELTWTGLILHHIICFVLCGCPGQPKQIDETLALLWAFHLIASIPRTTSECRKIEVNSSALSAKKLIN